MYFNAHLNVTIGGKELKTVVSVSASNDSQHIGGSCDLMVPLNCRISYKNPNNETVFLTEQPKNLFKSGDSIIIYANYDGYDRVLVFSGFIYDFIEGLHVTIKCLDYIYFFNLGIVGKDRVFYKKSKNSKSVLTGNGIAYKSITLKQLLQVLIDFVNDTIDDSTDGVTPVSLVLPMLDLTLVNITFVGMSPAAILDWLKKELGLNISLSGSKLFCNLASTTTKVVKLRTDRNVIKSGLQRAIASFQRLRVKAWFIRQDGTRDSFEVGDESGTMKEVFFYKVRRDETLYRTMAEDALLKYRQHKYNGQVETYLYPDVDLFYKIEYTDIRYPERSANYVVIGHDISIDLNGYHRTLKLAFLSDILNT